MFNLVKKIYITVDDKRELVENFIANNILKRWDNYERVDDLRKAGSLAVINAVCAYAQTYGLPALTDDVKEQIAETNVQVLKRLNTRFQIQLLKKSEMYLDRHGNI